MSPPSLINKVNSYIILRLTRLARNVYQNAKTLRVAASSSTLSPSYEANEQNFPRFCLKAWHPSHQSCFQHLLLRWMRDVVRGWGNEEKPRGWSREVFQKEGSSSTLSLEVSNQPILSLRIDRQSWKKESRRSRENFLSGSFVTRTLLYIHEGFVPGWGRTIEEGREALTWRSDNRRWSIFARENVSAGKEIFFRIAHPSQSDSLAWVAFNTTRKDEMTVMMLDWS